MFQFAILVYQMVSQNIRKPYLEDGTWMIIDLGTHRCGIAAQNSEFQGCSKANGGNHLSNPTANNRSHVTTTDMDMI